MVPKWLCGLGVLIPLRQLSKEEWFCLLLRAHPQPRGDALPPLVQP